MNVLLEINCYLGYVNNEMSVVFKPKILVVGPCEVRNMVLSISRYLYDCRLGKVTFPIS